MEFSVNSTFLFGVAICVIIFVLAQSVFFLVRAYRRGKQLGMTTQKLRKTVISSAMFTIAPAISILVGLIALSKALGIPLPWIRMSVIGAITYEMPAAEAAVGAFGKTLSDIITDPKIYATIAWVMTLGIMPSIILPPILMKRINGGMLKLRQKDSRWGDIFMTSLFLGMISAFLGVVFADIREGIEGWLPVFVLMVSAITMAVCGLLIKKFKWKWLETYAMSFSILVALVFAVVIAPIIGYAPKGV